MCNIWQDRCRHHCFRGSSFITLKDDDGPFVYLQIVLVCCSGGGGLQQASGLQGGAAQEDEDQLSRLNQQLRSESAQVKRYTTLHNQNYQTSTTQILNLIMKT